MNKKQKIDLAEKLKKLIETKTFGIVLSHQKLTFAQVDKVKKVAKNTTTIIKIKNKIAKKVLQDSVFETMGTNLKKENLFVFGDDEFDVCKVAKTLQENEHITILKASSKEQSDHEIRYVNTLAALGSKENLQSKLLNVISEVIRKLLRVINAKTQKENED